MLSKEKMLYQVKLILDYLPEEEYELIPQDIIDYIEDNFEYDENIVINSKVPLEEQDIDDNTYKELDKIIKRIKEENIQKVMTKEEVMQENLQLKQLVEVIKEENAKLPQVKDLVGQYKKALSEKISENEKLKENNQYLYDQIMKLPKLIRGMFFKDFDQRLLESNKENIGKDQ